MTRDDIIRMAREAGLAHMPGWVESGWGYDNLERFARLVYEATFKDANIAASRTIIDAAVLHEREACAKVADSQDGDDEGDAPDCTWSRCARHIAVAIRARGQA